MTVQRRNRAPADESIEALLAHDQPGLFTAIGELDWYSQSHRRWIDDQSFRAGDRVLEVGCATGALTVHIADAGVRVTGLDRSRDMIRRGMSDHPQLDLTVGDATRLPYDDSVFDGVVAASVVNIVDDAQRVVSEMHRVCAPGGTVSVLVPSNDFTDEDLDALIGRLGLGGFSLDALTKWHQGPPKMSRAQLEALLGSVDLEQAVTRSYLDGMLIAATAGSA